MAIYILMRLDLASGGVVGPGRIAILEGIDRYGSITASARAVGLTYRQVWNVVQVLNGLFKEPLIDVKQAGRSGGASLTPLGKQVIKHFRSMEDAANRALNTRLAAFERLTGENRKAPKRMPRWVEVKDPAWR